MIATSCANEDFVDQITVINDTDYPTQITVASDEDEASLALTTAPAHTERAVEEVIDQGQTWIFRFKYINKYEETAEVSRDELEESNWQVEVPESFSDALVEMGLEPPLQ
jgi:hypothetical protein